MGAELPILVLFDVEPDPRVTAPEGAPPWNGLDRTIEVVERWRSSNTDRPVSWFWRADAQVGRGHGDDGWALHQYRGFIDATGLRGDEHGLHPHLWRFSEPAGTWISDAADLRWAEQCVRSALATFERMLGRRAGSFRMGDGHMSTPILKALVMAGVSYDLTLEPGARGVPGLLDSELSTGMTPDRTATPRRPFRPSWRRPARASRWRGAPVWALPLTTAPDGIEDVEPGTQANLGFTPERFRLIVTAGLEASQRQGANYLAVVARTDVGASEALRRYLAENLEWLAAGDIEGAAPPARRRFVTPGEALERLVESKASDRGATSNG